MYSHIILVTGSRNWVSTVLITSAFHDAWIGWGPATIMRPLLVSGHCRKGADALAEQLWNDAGFDVKTFPVTSADWTTQGKKAGFLRNQKMVDFVVSQRAHSELICLGFAAPCVQPRCRKVPRAHVTHGTGDCMSRAIAAGISTREISDPRMPAF